MRIVFELRQLHVMLARKETHINTIDDLNQEYGAKLEHLPGDKNMGADELSCYKIPDSPPQNIL